MLSRAGCSASPSPAPVAMIISTIRFRRKTTTGSAECWLRRNTRKSRLADPETVKEYHDAEKRIADFEKQIKTLLERRAASFSERMAKESGRYLLAAWGLKCNNEGSGRGA